MEVFNQILVLDASMRFSSKNFIHFIYFIFFLLFFFFDTISLLIIWMD
jgi:hypothetical protein